MLIILLLTGVYFAGQRLGAQARQEVKRVDLMDQFGQTLDVRSLARANVNVANVIVKYEEEGTSREIALSLTRTNGGADDSGVESGDLSGGSSCVYYEQAYAATVDAHFQVCGSSMSGWILAERSGLARSPLIYVRSDAPGAAGHLAAVPRRIVHVHSERQRAEQDVDERVLLRRKRDRLGNAIVPLDSVMARYIELFIIVDSAARQKLIDIGISSNPSLVKNHLNQIVYLTNAKLLEVNLFIVLISFEVRLSTSDSFLSYEDGELMRVLQEYRTAQSSKKSMKNNIDHVVLITGRRMTQMSNAASMCLESSVSILPLNSAQNGQLSDNWILSAALDLTHLISDALGHNETLCSCDNDTRCVTDSSARSTQWSNCARDYLTQAPPTLMPADLCVLNKPKLMNKAKCGDLVLDKDEECDCGDSETCRKGPAFACCVPETCRFREPTYHCAYGECCNLTSCTFYGTNKVCRAAHDECDLPESCSGFSQECGADTWKGDGTLCNEANDYCYNGRCKTRDRQCRNLLRKAADVQNVASTEACLQNVHCALRKQPENSAQCAYNETDWTLGCTRLACDFPAGYYAEPKVHGMRLATVPNVNFSDEVLPSPRLCAYFEPVTQMQLSSLLVNVADGTKCGNGRMCVQGTCTTMSGTPKCRMECADNEVCDNYGHCQPIPVAASATIETTQTPTTKSKRTTRAMRMTSRSPTNTAKVQRMHQSTDDLTPALATVVSDVTLVTPLARGDDFESSSQSDLRWMVIAAISAVVAVAMLALVAFAVWRWRVSRSKKRITVEAIECTENLFRDDDNRT